MFKCCMCERDDTYIYYIGTYETKCQDCELISSVDPVELQTNTGTNH